MKVIERDLLTVESGLICHQVNCQGVMGSGIALAVKNKWPDVFAHYESFCNSEGFSNEKALGSYQLVNIGENLWVGNIFGQDDYRRKAGDKRVYTNYGAIQRAFADLRGYLDFTEDEGVPVYIPYLMGCDRGGGSWDIVSQIIDDVFPGVTACRL